MRPKKPNVQAPRVTHPLGRSHASQERRRAILFIAAAAIMGLVSPSALAGAPPEVSAQASVSVGAYADTDARALIDFREPLAAYGVWVDDPTYGTVWVPNKVMVGTGFEPYQTGGHWALTAGGEWLWVSTYAWGHIPFHYGRWTVTPGRGWVWIPGRRYAPAWVVWRVGDPDHVGWAPAPPTFLWRAGRAARLAAVPSVTYVFAPSKYVFREDLHARVIHDPVVVTRVMARSHDFRPAAAKPRALVRVSPSLTVARVPAYAAPRVRTEEDARATALATRRSAPRVAPVPRRAERATRGAARAGAEAGRAKPPPHKH
jgi:hypothetical protein